MMYELRGEEYQPNDRVSYYVFMVEGPGATGVHTATSSVWTAGEGPVRSVLADRVYELIKVKLMDNVVDPGARLSIDALSRDLDVSATPVREALARLESD